MYFCLKILQSEYIILIAVPVLVVTGITLPAIYGSGGYSGGGFGGSGFGDNVILAGIPINPSASASRTLQVTNTENPISIAVHIECDGQQPSTVYAIGEEVKNPSGVVVNKNQFNTTGAKCNNDNNDNNNDNDNQLFSTFQPDVQGQYTLIITNLSSDPIRIGGIFGHLPYR
jgi:hypothetical protein